MIPRVFAAVVRAVTAVRSLVAYECGAVGPGKDCAYENPILKAITGYPMAMEGKTSACAHLSPMGNLAAACCDTWSNESVQNIKLLGGMAPTCYMEQLAYDCRLMNTARAHGKESARQLQRWLVESDVAADPQAFIISPESSVELARVIVASDSHYHAGVAVARKAVELLRGAHGRGQVAHRAQRSRLVRHHARDAGRTAGKRIGIHRRPIGAGRPLALPARGIRLERLGGRVRCQFAIFWMR